MAEAPRKAASRNARVACPDCGVEFDRRGLAAHRRVRHAPSASHDASASESHDVAATSTARSLLDETPSLVTKASTVAGELMRDPTAHAPSDVPSWNDVSTWNGRSVAAQRVSLSFRAVDAVESGAKVETAAILPGHVLEAARATARVAATFTDAAPTDIALLCRSIDVLTDAVRRLDQHLDRLLDVRVRATEHDDRGDDTDDDDTAPPPLSSTATHDDHDTLERDLDAVLAEIAQVRSEGAPHAELARLRRRQADVVARLLALDNRDDVAINLRLVSADSGPARRRRFA